MRLLLDSLGRALLYCMLPRVIFMSLLPLVLLVAGVWGLMAWFWEPAIQAVLRMIEAQPLILGVVGWLESWGLMRIRAVLAPAILLLVFIPLMVVVSLLAVACLMMPALVGLVARRRFADLAVNSPPAWYTSFIWAGGYTLVALLCLFITLPLWLLPPVALVVPPLIWGWLTSKIMCFDALSAHASHSERRAVLLQHRYPLLIMGLVTGYLGAVPALLWATGAMWIAMAPVVVPLALWLYTMTFVFSGLWFAHYCLAALQDWRSQAEVSAADRTVDVSARTVDPASSAQHVAPNGSPQLENGR